MIMPKDEMRIPKRELIKVQDLVEDDNNPNVMSKHNFEALKKAIKKFGFIVPIITNQDLLIADGAHKWKAAKELGMKKVPVIKLDLKDVDRKILRQILNKLSGVHDEDLDLAEFRNIESEGELDLLKELLPEENKHIDKLLDSLKPSKLPDLDGAESVAQLGHLEIECPKCHHTFKKAK